MMLKLNDIRGMRIHFIGIGGVGMSGIARIMLDEGVLVSGSDMKDSDVLRGLQVLGATIFIGHQGEHISSADLIVASSAITEHNVEVLAATKKGILILARAEALAILMSESISVVVAGTHGKTTTTSMLTVALQRAGLDPSFAIGGLINNSATNAHKGSGRIFIAEADESDGTFLVYEPHGAIITNIELDHVDHFPDFDAVLNVFTSFVSSIKPQGFLIANGDDPGVLKLLALVNRDDLSIWTYGTDSDFSISRISLAAESSTARIAHNGSVLGELQLKIPGEHNIFNAVAALAAGIKLKVPVAKLFEGLSSFTGTRRRFEYKGSGNGVRVIDDYGHHPTEVSVTLGTAKRYAGDGRVLVIFQPHRYSRTQAFFKEFAAALAKADLVYLLEVYPASENPIPGVNSALIAKHIAPNRVRLEPSMLKMVDLVVAESRKGDVIITMGAGDISALAPVIVDALQL